MMNLNKENFLTPDWLQEFPKAGKHFYNFVDETKRELDWYNLFNEYEDCPAPKFHDLPLELQFGIVIKWIGRFKPYSNRVYVFPTDEKEFAKYLLRLNLEFFNIEENHL